MIRPSYPLYAQENGVATAVESIYRDLEYARTLIKAAHVAASSEDDEHETIRVSQRPSSASHSTPERNGSAESHESGREAPSEDWSVISDNDDRRSSRHSDVLERSPSTRRSNLAAAVFSVLPDVLTSTSARSHSRT